MLFVPSPANMGICTGTLFAIVSSTILDAVMAYRWHEEIPAWVWLIPGAVIGVFVLNVVDFAELLLGMGVPLSTIYSAVAYVAAAGTAAGVMLYAALYFLMIRDARAPGEASD